jgi:hypothetical protein
LSDISLRKLLIQRLAKEAGQQWQTTTAVGTKTGFTNAEVMVDKMIEAALEKKEWAAMGIMHALEGKPGTAKVREGDEELEMERLNELTQTSINDLARASGVSEPVQQPAQEGGEEDAGGDGELSELSDPGPSRCAGAGGGGAFEPGGSRPVPTGPASRLLDLPSNRTAGS